MPKKICLNFSFAPVVDGKRDGVKAHRTVSKEEPAKVDSFDLVQHGVEAGDLADVIADDVEEAPGDIRLTEWIILSSPKLRKGIRSNMLASESNLN